MPLDFLWAQTTKTVTEGCYLEVTKAPFPQPPFLKPQPKLTPLRGSSQRGFSLAHPDGVRQPCSEEPIWGWQYQVAQPLLTGLLGLPPAQPLPWELAHLVCSLHYLSRGHWSCRVGEGSMGEKCVGI